MSRRCRLTVDVSLPAPLSCTRMVPVGLLSDLRACLQQLQRDPASALAEGSQIDIRRLRRLVFDVCDQEDQLNRYYATRHTLRHALLSKTDDFIFELVQRLTDRVDLERDALRSILPDALAYTLHTCGRLGNDSDPKFEGISGANLSLVYYACDDAWTAFEKRSERRLPSPRSYALELRLVINSGSQMKVSSAGEHFLHLSGETAIRWLIALEFVGALDKDDDWRGHPSIAKLFMAREGRIEAYDHEFQYEVSWPWDNPALARWEEMGLLKRETWKRGEDEPDGGERYELTGLGRAVFDELLAPESSLVQRARTSLSIGSHQVREYDVREEIGAGGYGTVHRVVRRVSGVELEFALKFFHPHPFNTDRQKAIERFWREIKVIVELQHRGIVPCVDAGVEPQGRPYLVMPYVKGEDLQKAYTGMSLRRRASVLVEVLRAVGYAHRQSVLHRDLKPSNIRVRESDGQPIILDFGLSYIIDISHDAMLTTRAPGTPGYVPPEVQANPADRRPGHDIYSCGVMLFQIFANRQPRFPSESLGALDPNLERLDPIVKRALAPVDERYSSASEFADALASAAELLPDGSGSSQG